MKELLASGIINGNPVEVLCETNNGAWCFTFNGCQNEELDARLRHLMKVMHRVGNYRATTMKLNLCGIFDGYEFFNGDTNSIKVFGNIEQIPCEDGCIY